jgi:hypothetical protein
MLVKVKHQVRYEKPPIKLSVEKVTGSTYILLIHFDKACSIIVGKLGLISIKKGYYLYAGSAKRAIQASHTHKK